MLCHPCDEHRLPVWLGRASSTVDLFPSSNYGTFVVEWWTPMCSKKEPKSLVARECWTRRWTPEVIYPQRISVTTVLYSHRMLSHKDKRPPKMHLILEASTVMVLSNLANSTAVGGDNVGTDCDDKYLVEKSNSSIGSPLIVFREGGCNHVVLYILDTGAPDFALSPFSGFRLHYCTFMLYLEIGIILIGPGP